MDEAIRAHGKRVKLLDSTAAVVLTLGAIALAGYLFAGGRGLDVDYITTRYPLFLEGATVSLYATTISFLLGMGIGFLVGWARATPAVPIQKVIRDHTRWSAGATPARRSTGSLSWVVAKHALKHSLRRIADGYVEVMRGTPLFVQIVLAWSILLVYAPGLHPPTLVLIAGLTGLTLNTGAYQGEIFRAGIQTVHAGQVEAARALGLSRWGAMRNVVLPQALRLVIPPMTNEFIALLKASSLLFVLGIAELTTVGKTQAFLSARVFEVFALVAALYLLMTVPVSKAVERVERKYRIPGLGIQTTTRGR